MPLVYRVAALNALVLITAVAVTIALFLSPHRVSSFVLDEEAGALVAALVLVALVNLYLLRRVVRPLQALTALARRVDLVDARQRMPAAEPASEAGELALTFNEMLDDSRPSGARRPAGCSPARRPSACA